MAFTNFEIQLIHKLVGEFCERKIPRHVRDKVRLSYEIDNHQVVIFEERSVSDGSSKWITVEIAKLRYVRRRNEWQPYWKRANDKWWPYEPHGGSKTLAALIQEIDMDSDGCFFG